MLRQLLQIVATDLNVQPQDILQQMRGKTLAEVIQANNGDVTKITADITTAVTTAVNQAVTSGQLTQDRANQILSNLSTTVQDALQGNGIFGFGGRGLGTPGLNGGGFGGRGFGGQQRHGTRPLRQDMLGVDVRPLISAAADATKLTAQQIAEQIRGGKTLGEVITANGGDPAVVESTAITTATQALDKFRTNGSLTQDQENAMVNGLKAFYDAVLNGAFRQQVTPASTAVAPSGSV